jgi:uncharacterized membrane protein (UPF0127 family)
VKSFLSAVTGAPPGTAFELVDADTGRVLVPVLEVATESATRKRGLLGRDGLPEDAGLVIAPTNAVHTFFMRFPIDIVFVSRAGAVLKVREAVSAWRMTAAWGGYAVVETAAGRAGRAGLVRGGRVVVRRRESGAAGSFV